MRPTLLTRITDPILDGLDRIGKWIDGKSQTGDPVPHDARVQWVTMGALVIVLGTGFMLDGGNRGRAVPFFGALVALMLAIAAYGAWSRSHPLPPVHERTKKHDLVAGVHGLAGGALMFGALRVIDSSIEGGAGLTPYFSLFCALVTCYGVFEYRTAEKEARPRKSTVGIALMVGGWFVEKAVGVVTSMLP